MVIDVLSLRLGVVLAFIIGQGEIRMARGSADIEIISPHRIRVIHVMVIFLYVGLRGIGEDLHIAPISNIEAAFDRVVLDAADDFVIAHRRGEDVLAHHEAEDQGEDDHHQKIDDEGPTFLPRGRGFDVIR